MCEGLQTELQQKEDLYVHLKNDFSRLEQRYKESTIQGDKDRQMRMLEDELSYVRRHSDMEVSLLKDENEILKKEMESLKSEYFKRTMNTMHESTMNQSNNSTINLH